MFSRLLVADSTNNLKAILIKFGKVFDNLSLFRWECTRIFPVVLLNRSQTTQAITVDWEMLNLPQGLNRPVRDLWQKKNLAKTKNSFTADVVPHSVVMVRFDL